MVNGGAARARPYLCHGDCCGPGEGGGLQDKGQRWGRDRPLRGRGAGTRPPHGWGPRPLWARSRLRGTLPEPGRTHQTEPAGEQRRGAQRADEAEAGMQREGSDGCSGQRKHPGPPAPPRPPPAGFSAPAWGAARPGPAGGWGGAAAAVGPDRAPLPEGRRDRRGALSWTVCPLVCSGAWVSFCRNRHSLCQGHLRPWAREGVRI